MKTFKQLHKELKTELKLIASNIRALKNQRKGSPNGYVSGLDGLRWDFRSKHIAYCLLRGRTIDEIEPNCYAGTYASEVCRKDAFELFEQYKTTLGDEYGKAPRNSA